MAFPEGDLKVLFTTWKTIVKTFMRRKLTFPSDRLPAISGTASILARLKLGWYLAGLWEVDLIKQLQWQCTGDDRTERSYVYRAPSGSWVLVNCEIRFCMHYDNIEMENVYNPQILEINCRQNTIDPFGSGKRGFPIITSLFQPGLLRFMLAHRVKLVHLRR